MKPILVTGATGYIGGRLIPKLLETGHPVRCLVRDAARLQSRSFAEEVETVEGDVLEPSSLAPAFAGIDTAYYLIHSMGASARGFEDRDREAARNFAEAAAAAGVKHIVYLGGLGDEASMSPHLESRQETGRMLAGAGVGVTEFRAAIIVGSGSISFEMIRYLTERLPVMVTPKWVETRVQPIGIRAVLEYLLRALELPAEGHKVVEIGGTDVMTYREMILGYARVRGLERRFLPVPVLTPRLSSYWVNIVTPIPASIARPLILGLRSEVIVNDPEPAKAYGVTPLPYETTVKLALDRSEQGAVETLWSGALSAVPRGTPIAQKFEDKEGLLVDRQTAVFALESTAVYSAISRIGGTEGWYAFNRLWQVRGVMDKLVGGIGMRRGRRHPEELLPGDAIDFWRVESVEPNCSLQLRAEMKVPGRAWLRFDLRPHEGGTEVVQTAFFEPKGLFGYLYWWAVYPLHLLVFPGMLRAIGERAKHYAQSPVPPNSEAPLLPEKRERPRAPK